MKTLSQILHKNAFLRRIFFNSGNLFPLKCELGFDTTLPSVNIAEEDGGFNIDVIAPGFNKEDFKVDIENNILTITAHSVSSNFKENADDATVHKSSYQYNSFKRSFHLPKNIREYSISATYKDGMLQLNIPKCIPAKQKKVQVK